MTARAKVNTQNTAAEYMEPAILSLTKSSWVGLQNLSVMLASMSAEQMSRPVCFWPWKQLRVFTRLGQVRGGFLSMALLCLASSCVRNLHAALHCFGLLLVLMC